MRDVFSRRDSDERQSLEEGARVELVRAESSFIRRYTHSLNEAVDAANLGTVRSKGEDTALYLVEARVRRLLPL